MSARVLILLMALLGLVFRLVKMRLADIQRKQPLPEEVADVYDAARYQQYLNYVADNRRAGLIFSLITLAADTLLYFSPLYRPIEAAAGGDPYLIFLLTLALFTAVETVIDVISAYYDKFHIEEKYGLNRQDLRGFVKDTALSFLGSLAMSLALGMLLVFIGEHLGAWTNNFSIGLGQAALIGLGILAAVAVFVLLGSLLSIFILKKQYTFTPMEEGALREKIMALQQGAKKQVKIINVYDESKKSTSKNAFLLKLLWHREFGIADNFINENAEEELLAVLSHEIGHLKHRKNLLNFIQYGFAALAALAVIYLIWQPGLILRMNEWIRASFDITVNNYNLWLAVVSSVLTPLIKGFSVFSNYRSRQEEHEADREAVKNGYGEALIATFKRVSSDELINVNPHPVIEFLEYDHPGMYQRIKAIREAEKDRG